MKIPPPRTQNIDYQLFAKTLIEEHFGKPDCHTWENGQFVAFAAEIAKHEKINPKHAPGIDTLKRFCGKQTAKSNFSQKKKDSIAVFLGFGSWAELGKAAEAEFARKAAEEEGKISEQEMEAIQEIQEAPEAETLPKAGPEILPEPEKQDGMALHATPPQKTTGPDFRRLAFATALFSALLAIFFFWPEPKPLPGPSLRLSSYIGKVPQTVYFNYSDPGSDTGQLWLDFGMKSYAGGKTSPVIEGLDSREGKAGKTYIKPGFYMAKLLKGGKTLDSCRFYIASNRWGLFTRNSSERLYDFGVEGDSLNFFLEGGMRAPDLPSPYQYEFIHFMLGQRFVAAPGAPLRLSAKMRKHKGGDARIGLADGMGNVYQANFLDTGYTADSYLQTGKNRVSGKTEPALAALQTPAEGWFWLSMELSGGMMRLSRDGKHIMEYPLDSAPADGAWLIDFVFKGNAWVDSVCLTAGGDTLLFDDFIIRKP